MRIKEKVVLKQHNSDIEDYKQPWNQRMSSPQKRNMPIPGLRDKLTTGGGSGSRVKGACLPVEIFVRSPSYSF